jgi:hypothetical protein
MWPAVAAGTSEVAASGGRSQSGIPKSRERTSSGIDLRFPLRSIIGAIVLAIQNGWPPPKKPF